MSNLVPIAQHLKIISTTADVQNLLEKIDVVLKSYQMITGKDPIDRVDIWLKTANYPGFEHLPEPHRSPFFQHLFNAMRKGLEAGPMVQQIKLSNIRMAVK